MLLTSLGPMLPTDDRFEGDDGYRTDGRWVVVDVVVDGDQVADDDEAGGRCRRRRWFDL